MRFFYSCEIVKQIISLFGLTVLKDHFTSYVRIRISWFVQSGGERIRTDDPLRARQMLSQLSYTPNDILKYQLGLSGVEPPTLRLSVVRSNQLSYRPFFPNTRKRPLVHSFKTGQ